jgi:hypothetical protein
MGGFSILPLLRYTSLNLSQHRINMGYPTFPPLLMV